MTLTVITDQHRPPAWNVLADALQQRRPVRARYHGQTRLLCPHLLGWKHGRAKALCYQADGPTSQGALPSDPRQRWRSLFIDEITDITITTELWTTPTNYSLDANCVDCVELAVPTALK